MTKRLFTRIFLTLMLLFAFTVVFSVGVAAVEPVYDDVVKALLAYDDDPENTGSHYVVLDYDDSVSIEFYYHVDSAELRWDYYDSREGFGGSVVSIIIPSEVSFTAPTFTVYAGYLDDENETVYTDTLETMVTPRTYTFKGGLPAGTFDCRADKKDLLADIANNGVANIAFFGDQLLKEIGTTRTMEDFAFTAFDYANFFHFNDVNFSRYFFTPVNWALANGVTAGKTKTSFAPNDPCTRAQCVTFLWRAQNSPAPTVTATPFTDIVAASYYEKAAFWAYEKKIVAGMTDTTFGPNAPCTRAQVVTFLYRAAGEPEFTYPENPFTDVGNGGAYYTDAVAWAVTKGITAGTTPTTFSPNQTCTRAQIVSFLQRYMKLK